MIDALTGQGINVRHACRCLGVSESGYYAWRSRPTSPRALRAIFLAGEITVVHRDSGGVYGAHRITAELRYGRQIIVGLVVPHLRGHGILESRRQGLTGLVQDFVLDRGAHPEGRVAALAVVEDLQVLEHRVCQLDPRAPAGAVEQLDLHPGPEGLGDGVSSASPTVPIEANRPESLRRVVNAQEVN